MGEEETLANGATTTEQKVEDILQKKGEDKDVVKQIKESAKDVEGDGSGAHKMDIDPNKDDKESKEDGVDNQEYEEAKNVVIEEKKKVKTDPTRRDGKENKEEENEDSTSKQDEEAARNQVAEEKKEEMETDSMSKEDKDAKVENVSEQEEEETQNETAEGKKEQMEIDTVSKEDKETKEEDGSKQEEEETRNEVAEEKIEEMEAEPVNKEDKETKEEVGSKQEEEETRNGVSEEKKEMEVDPVKEDQEIQEEGKEENVAKQEEETKDVLDNEKEDEKTEEENEAKEETEIEPVEEAMEDEDMSAKDREESKEKEMEEDEKARANEEDTEKEVKARVKNSKKEIEKAEESKLDTGKKSDTKEVEEKGPKTPMSLLSDRPVRERKSVERLVASIEKDTGRKFQIKKGRGTALKDIPNVAYKLSKRKVGDDTLKLLHTIFFGRIAKADKVKSNISQFSGFVSSENEERQKMKLKEKLVKCPKEKLAEFCDVLDIPIAKTYGRKDIVVKLVDFLMSPEPTTTELLAEKEQLSQGKKRKRTGKGSGSEYVGLLSKNSAKRHTKKKDDEENEQDNDEESDDAHEQKDEQKEEDDEEEDATGVPEKSKNEVSDPFETEEENDDMDEDYSEDEKLRKKRRAKRHSAKKESVAKAKAKKTATPKKSGPTKKTPTRPSSKRRKIDSSSYTSPKTLSRKEKTDSGKEKRKASTPKQPSSEEKSGIKAVRGKDKSKEETLTPSDAVLRKAISKILTEVDFNKATFKDILKQLAVKFKSDFAPRKSSIKQMIKDELTRLAEETDNDDHLEEDEEGVKA